ncbi:MAG: hypothetical protein LBV74_04515 [Tannerella sp.]|jgi:hypothetical protein|nr:hypothetical protein [Tannerella sp.]
MKQFLIRIIYLFAGISFCITANAQEQEMHEISVYAASGLSTLQYDLNGGTRDNRIGGGIGVSYGFFFNDYWGITAGGEISGYYAKARMQPFSGGDYVENKNLTYNYDVSNYYENHEFVVISIPVMFQYQAPLLLEDHFCYAAIGAKIGFPWGLRHKTSGATYTTTGINHDDNSIIDSPASEGFGTFTEKRNKHFIDYKTSYMLSAEIGMKWSLSHYFFLYTSVYCDYGLNDIVKTGSDQSFVSYNQNSPSTIYHHAMFDSSYGQVGERVSFTNKVTPLALGLKIKFTFMPPGKCY